MRVTREDKGKEHTCGTEVGSTTARHMETPSGPLDEMVAAGASAHVRRLVHQLLGLLCGASFVLATRQSCVPGALTPARCISLRCIEFSKPWRFESSNESSNSPGTERISTFPTSADDRLERIILFVVDFLTRGAASTSAFWNSCDLS